MNYENFDLEIICPQGGDRLRARVLESPEGDCPFIDVKWPVAADTENRLLTDIHGGLWQGHGRSMQANSIQDFGGKLFDAVFSGDIEHLFRSSFATSFREGKGLRIRLRLPEDSELHMRPWELLFDTKSREFLAVSVHTPLVRYLPVAQPIPPITVEGPLRVLVALSSPTDHPRIDIAREWEILCHALEPSISAGQLVLGRIPGHCTFDKLRDSLRHFGAHVFHFVGHGIAEALVLERESGKGLEMEAAHLRSAFPGGALPRLIVLNACSGAITREVPFSGLAQGCLRQGVPAVVAMQSTITDDAAMIFTRYFYRDLAEIGAVDASLNEARLRMQGNGHPIGWGMPVLYMRAPSGQLFRQEAAKPALDPAGPDITAKIPPQQAEEFTVPLPPEPKPAERQVPPDKLEPGLDEDNTLWNAQPRPFVPEFTFDPGPARPLGTKRVRVVATAGLLAAVAGIAVGVKFLPSTRIMPAAAPSRPDATAATVPIAPVTSSTAIPHIETAPVAPESVGEDIRGPRVQAKERQSKPKFGAVATREGQRRRRSATAARGDICKNAVVSERPASCLFKKQ